MVRYITRNVKRQKVSITMFNLNTKTVETETLIIEAMPEKKIAKFFENCNPSYKVLTIEVIEDFSEMYRMTVENFIRFAEEVKND